MNNTVKVITSIVQSHPKFPGIAVQYLVTKNATAAGRRLGRLLTLFLAVATIACSAESALPGQDPPPPPAPPPPPPPPPPPGACSYAGAALPVSDVVVTIDPATRFQVLDGFGTTQRVFDDGHLTDTFDPATGRGTIVIPLAEQQRILAALYSEIGLTRVRYATEPNIEPVNDNADPAVTDLSMFNFAWKRVDGHIDYVNAARAFGVTTWFGSPIRLEPWMSRTDPAEYVEWAMAIIRRWRDRGATLPYWSILNEPGLVGPYSGEFVRDAVKLLGAKLAGEGISTKLVIPDDLNPTKALARVQVVMADPAARQYVAAFAFHLYQTGYSPNQTNASLAALAALGRQYNVPLWMTEWYSADWFNWARTMHDMLATYDASVVDYMWGFFGQWQNNGSVLITVKSSGTTYTGLTKNKQYWVVGQYSAFVRPGAVRIGATSSNPNIAVTAWLDGTKMTVVALNVGPTDYSVRFDFGTGSPCVRTVDGTWTSATANWRIVPTMQVNDPRFVATLPATTITSFVAQ